MIKIFQRLLEKLLRVQSYLSHGWEYTKYNTRKRQKIIDKMEINMSTYNQRRYLNMCVSHCSSVIREKLTPYSCFVAISFFLSQGSDLL